MVSKHFNERRMGAEHGMRNTTGLLWTALLISVIGGTISYMFFTQPPTPDTRANLAISLAGTILGVGICIISATANWWLRR